MSPEQPSEMDQLDLLAAELAEAGKIARISTTPRARPDGVFMMRLRGELLSSYGADAVASLEASSSTTTEDLDIAAAYPTEPASIAIAAFPAADPPKPAVASLIGRIGRLGNPS